MWFQKAVRLESFFRHLRQISCFSDLPLLSAPERCWSFSACAVWGCLKNLGVDGHVDFCQHYQNLLLKPSHEILTVDVADFSLTYEMIMVKLPRVAFERHWSRCLPETVKRLDLRLKHYPHYRCSWTWRRQMHHCSRSTTQAWTRRYRTNPLQTSCCHCSNLATCYYSYYHLERRSCSFDLDAITCSIFSLQLSLYTSLSLYQSPGHCPCCTGSVQHGASLTHSSARKKKLATASCRQPSYLRTIETD